MLLLLTYAGWRGRVFPGRASFAGPDFRYTKIFGGAGIRIFSTQRLPRGREPDLSTQRFRAAGVRDSLPVRLGEGDVPGGIRKGRGSDI